MLLLPQSAAAQQNVIKGMLRFLQHPNEKIRSGFLSRLEYLDKHFETLDVVLIFYDNKADDRQPGFDLSWYNTGENHPHERQQRPYMVGGLILHSDGDWGVHT